METDVSTPETGKQGLLSRENFEHFVGKSFRLSGSILIWLERRNWRSDGRGLRHLAGSFPLPDFDAFLPEICEEVVE